MFYQRFLRKSTYRRYGIFILTIFFSYHSIQAIINNKTIDASIEEVRRTNNRIQEEIAWKDNFYTNYLQGEYAPFFLGHENGQLYRGERVIRFRMRAVEEALQLPTVETEINLKDLTPQDSWTMFIENRLHNLQSLGIIQ